MSQVIHAVHLSNVTHEIRTYDINHRAAPTTGTDYVFHSMYVCMYIYIPR